MTAQRRYSVKLANGTAVILECKKCHSCVSYPMRNWKKISYGCVNCNETRIIENGTDYRILDGFRETIQRLVDVSDSFPYEVRLEFDALAEEI